MPARLISTLTLHAPTRGAALAIPGTGSETNLWPYVVPGSFTVSEALGDPGEAALQFVTGSPPAVADPPILTRRRVLRATYSDGTMEEWRVTRYTRELSGESPPSLAAQSLWLDLGTRAARKVTSGGFVDLVWWSLSRTVADQLALIFADAPSPWIAGTVAAPYASKVVSLQASGSTHLELLTQLCEEAGCEWQERYVSGTDRWAVDLVTERGGDGTRPVEMALGGAYNNRRTLARTIDAGDYFSRVLPLGGPDDETVTMARATWAVTAAVYDAGTNRTTLTLADSPIYVTNGPAGAGEALSFGTGSTWYTGVSTAVPSTLVVSGDARGLTQGRFRYLDGGDLTTWADPAAESAAGVVERVERISDAAPAENLLAAAGISVDMRASSWGGSPTMMPAGWSRGQRLPDGTWSTASLPTVAQETDAAYARAGGMAMKVTATAAGQGVRGGAVTLTPTTRNPYHATSTAVRVASGGGVRLEIIGSDGRSYPVNESATSTEDLLRALQIPGRAIPAGPAYLQVTATVAGTVFWVDTATLTNSNAAYDYAERMGPSALWHAAGLLLAQEGGLTPDALEGVVFDTAYLPGSTTAEILIGTRVQVTDAGMAGQDLRVVQLTRRIAREGGEWEKTFALSRRRLDLVDRDSPGRQLRKALPPVVTAPAVPRARIVSAEMRDDDADWRMHLAYTVADAATLAVTSEYVDSTGTARTEQYVRSVASETLAVMAHALGVGNTLTVTAVAYAQDGTAGDTLVRQVTRPAAAGTASITAAAQRTTDGACPSTGMQNTVTYTTSNTAAGQEVRVDRRVGGGAWAQVATGLALGAGQSWSETRRPGSYYSATGTAETVQYRARLVTTATGAAVTVGGVPVQAETGVIDNSYRACGSNVLPPP